VVVDALAELIKDWTVEEIVALHDQVPRHALATPFRRGTLQDVAKRVLTIARDGLKRRNRRDRTGERDESPFLNELVEIAETGRTPAQMKLDEFHGRWNGNIDPLFREYAY